MCSVTLRRESAWSVLDVVASARLSRIEWGAAVHVPSGEPEAAALMRSAGLDRGVRAASYGSYFRAGPPGADDFPAVLPDAVTLGARLIDEEETVG